MKRIRFTSTEQYESEGRNKGPIFEADSVHDFADDFADRWLRRNVAVEVDQRTPLTPAGAAPAEPAAQEPVEPGDGLDALEWAQVRDIAKVEEADVKLNSNKPTLIAAIRARRTALAEAAENDGLDALDDDALVEKAEAAGIDDYEGRDDLIAKIRAAAAKAEAETDAA